MQASKKTAVAAAAGALAAALTAAPAQAHEVDLTAGSTSLRLSAQASGALRALGVRATGTRFEVTGGRYTFHALDDGGGGDIEHDGTLVLRGRGATVRLQDPTVRIKPSAHHARAGARGRAAHATARGTLTASVGGRRITVATLDTRRYKPTEEIVGFVGLGLKLTAPAANLLDRAFDTDAFDAGLALGELTNRSAAPLTITGGETRVTLNPAAVQTLTAAGAGLAPLPGTSGAGSTASPLVFPVTRSRFDWASFKGSFTHTGGVRLTAPAGRTFGGRPALDLANFRVYYGPKGYALDSGSLKLFTLKFVKKSTFDDKPNIVFGGLELYFTDAAARVVAPALGLDVRRLTRLKLGEASLRATFRQAS